MSMKFLHARRSGRTSSVGQNAKFRHRGYEENNRRTARTRSCGELWRERMRHGKPIFSTETKRNVEDPGLTVDQQRWTVRRREQHWRTVAS